MVVRDTVLDTMTVRSVSSDYFDCSRGGNEVTCTRDSMAPRDVGTVTITVRVNDNALPQPAVGATVEGLLENVATVETDTEETNLDNNTDDASIPVIARGPVDPCVENPESCIPDTGSDLPGTVLPIALSLVLLGGGLVLLGKRRRNGNVTA